MVMSFSLFHKMNILQISIFTNKDMVMSFSLSIFHKSNINILQISQHTVRGKRAETRLALTMHARKVRFYKSRRG